MSSEFDIPSAPLGRRFLTYFVDAVVIIAVLLIAMFAFVGSMLSEISTIDQNDREAMASLGFTIIAVYLVLTVGAFMYWVLMEGLKGQTIGKMAAGTIVVTTDGQPITVGKAFVRTICRLIPFEVFSGLFRNSREFWHDSLPDTRVVMKEEWEAYLDGDGTFEEDFE